jgi:hypothetical protein
MVEVKEEEDGWKHGVDRDIALDTGIDEECMQG